ncbi:MAG: motility protein A [Calditrichaeota bacterium]|nr:motility protein A [Calditrichota bacterium]
MDLATIIGIVVGVFLILFAILQSGQLTGFIDVGSIMIVFGGTIGATLINFPLSDVLSVIGVIKKGFLNKPPDPTANIRMLVEFAEIARREGILALEDRIKDIDDPFLKEGIQLAVDGTEPDLMKTILDTEIESLQNRHELGASIMKTMGTYAPAYGMIGTVIGLILMLGTMSDPSTIGPSMAVALITTFYGAVLANLIFLPLAGKLETISSQEVMVKELVREGVLSIQSGDNPRIVEQKLVSFIPPKKRAVFEEKE